MSELEIRIFRYLRELSLANVNRSTMIYYIRQQYKLELAEAERLLENFEHLKNSSGGECTHRATRLAPVSSRVDVSNLSPE